MDVLVIILRTVREAIQATGAPPDPVQAALDDAERSLRRSLGGAVHHISRAPDVPKKARIAQLLQAEPALTPGDVAQRLGVTSAYVRMIRQQLRLDR